MATALLIISLLLPVHNDLNEINFSRDNLRVAFNQWVELHGAELVDTGELEHDRYGYVQHRNYNTNKGLLELTLYYSHKNEVYDVGLRQSEEVVEIASTKLDRIVSRVVWAASLKESVLVSTLWFVGTGSVQINYDDRIGSQNELLRVFIEDVQSSDLNVALSGLESNDEFSVIRLTVDGKDLNMQIKPNINLYLNGQVDVITQKIDKGLTELMDHGMLMPHTLHNVISDEESLSARFIARDRSDYLLEFAKVNMQWEPVKEPEAFGYSHPYHFNHFNYWATRNFPNGSRVNPSFSADFEATINVEGLDDKTTITDVVHFNEVIGWLGSELLTHVEVSRFNEDDNGQIETTTYILYFDPDLLYQHMIRVRDKFDGEVWASSDMLILPSIRLDNIGNVYGRSNFPIREYETLFEVDSTN